MVLIGIIADTIEYDNIKKNITNKELQLYHITKSNIQNFQNIVFDTIIIMKKLDLFSEQVNILTKMFKQTKYLICNADICIEIALGGTNANITLITYGFNSKASIVVSSVTDEKLLIDIQREIVLENGKVLELGEQIMTKIIPLNTYENLVIFIISLIYPTK